MDIREKESAMSQVNEKYTAIEFCLDERGRRLWAATEARALGRGGVTIVSRAIER